jgi:hypothetical protein
VRAWAARYKDQGLVVLGVHSPEFEFEKNVENIRPALGRFRIDYPVAVDSDHAVWDAFRNHYWPAVYVVDAKGNIRHHQFGEGEYDRTEVVIQQLLREAGYPGTGNDAVVVDPRGSEVAADWSNLGSPEAYLGGDRSEGFVSSSPAAIGKSRSYVAPRSLALNHWALSGDWTVNAGAIVVDKANGRLAYRFHARDVHLVMGLPSRGASARFRVLLDGRPPGTAHGVDVDEQGYGTATEQRLYQLIRRGPDGRDRVPRSRRRGVRLHVRMTRIAYRVAPLTNYPGAGVSHEKNAGSADAGRVRRRARRVGRPGPHRAGHRAGQIHRAGTGGGSRFPSSGDTNPGKWSPSVRTALSWRRSSPIR